MNLPDLHPGPIRPMLSRRFAWRAAFMFAALVSILLTVGTQVYRTIGEFVQSHASATHTLEVKQEIALSVSHLRHAEANQRAFLVTGDAQRLADYLADVPEITTHLRRLGEIVQSSPQQASNIEELQALIDKRLASMTQTTAVHEQLGFAAAREALRSGSSREDDLAIDIIAARMLQFEDSQLDALREHTLEQAVLTRALTLGAIVLCIVLLGFALLLVLREQLRRLASEARAKSSNMELAYSLDESRRLSETLRRLSQFGELLQGCRSMDEALEGLREALPRLLPGTAGSVNLLNASQNLVEPCVSWGTPDIRGDNAFGPNDCWAMRRGQAHPPASAIVGFLCKHIDGHQADPERVHLCVPMVAHGEMLGTLTVSSPPGLALDHREVAITAGEQVSMAMANLRLQETLRTQSLRDPLTGLFNRRYLEASLDREVQRAQRRDTPLSVLMLDIDHFKRFNDSHGHDAGDALLAQFGALLARIVRSEDVACRYGGEEFTVLLPETDAALAMERAEQIRAAVHGMELVHRKQALGPISVSIGVASFPQSATTSPEFMRSADRALYAAKHGGRNRVHMVA